MITPEKLNAIPGRPCTMLPWKKREGTKSDFHYLECVGDGIDLPSSFEIIVCWLDGSPMSIYAHLPDLGPGCPAWDDLVDYAREVHKVLETQRDLEELNAVPRSEGVGPWEISDTKTESRAGLWARGDLFCPVGTGRLSGEYIRACRKIARAVK